MGEEMADSILRTNVTSTVSVQIFYMLQSYDMLYFPSEGKRAEDFCRPKNPTASAGFETANLGTRGQHANH
jgi:hypothetical protein